MDRNYRINTLRKWGQLINSTNWSSYYQEIGQSNPWFNAENIELSISAVNKFLDVQNLNKWSRKYPERKKSSKLVGIIMAGNLPLVGLHDLLCVYISGHRAMVKLSNQDNLLLPMLYNKLAAIEPEIKSSISFIENLNQSKIDALIATGSDNTSRYIRHYFNEIPSIIRSNRTSIAIINGNESQEQLSALGNDIYSYFGRGCRNISKLLVPPNYDFNNLISSNVRFISLLNHSKYLNNYRYHSSLLKTRKTAYINSGYSLFTKNTSLVSPLSVIYYDHYQDLDSLESYFGLNKHKIQCIGAADCWYDGSHDFGTLQFPELWDYSDNIDTMGFLSSLN